MNGPAEPLLVLIPVLNDWEAVEQLIPRIDSAMRSGGRRAHVVIVDDGSEDRPSRAIPPCPNLVQVDILRLRRNVGHQQAISIGLAYCSKNLPERTVVVMDGDGEDDPEDILRLCAAFEEEGGRKVVFAERRRRSESLRFRFFYLLYRFIHWLLTGRRIRFGNFSIVPHARVRQLVVASELFNHYAATVVKTRIPYRLVPTRRRTRLSGTSGMNFVNLVVHGLNALSVFGEEIVTRMLIFGGIVMAACVFAAGAVGSIRFLTDIAVPGWATYTMAFLVVIFLQTLTACFVSSFVILNMKNQAIRVPERDFGLYVAGFTPYPGSDVSA